MSDLRMKQALVAVLFFSAAVLAGCDSSEGLLGSPKTAQFVSTAKFFYEGSEVTQENPVHCKFVNLKQLVSLKGDLAHRRAVLWVDGDRHWLKRRDGSIIIFPQFQSCIDGAEPGERREVMTREEHLAPLSDETFVFDRSYKPTKVDILTADAFASAAEDSVLRSVTLTRADNPLTKRLAKEFPSFEQTAPESDPLRTQGLGADMNPGMFVGVQAKAFILASNTKCGTSATVGVVILPEQDRCRFVNDCKRSDQKTVCGKDAGGLRVSYDASFSIATIALSEPDPKYQMTLYDSRLTVFGHASGTSWNNRRKWAPRLCVDRVCTTPIRPFLPILFYVPAKHLVIEARLVRRKFDEGMFSARRML
jgi:hypothetical protein